MTITTAQAATLLQLSESYVRSLCHAGEATE